MCEVLDSLMNVDDLADGTQVGQIEGSKRPIARQGVDERRRGTLRRKRREGNRFGPKRRLWLGVEAPTSSGSRLGSIRNGEETPI